MTDFDSKPGMHAIRFTGTGREYFGIWIVNILLTIVTLGIYSAWAKVRTARYMYDNTHLAGASFDYHGRPVAILKGRIVAVALIVAYQTAFQVDPLLGFVSMALLAAVVPWLIWKSLQFKLHNSSYRGIRFGFRGSLPKAYAAYLLAPLAAFLSLGIALPWAHQRIKKFQHEESRFGTAYFSFTAKARSFYRVYAVAALFLIGAIVLIASFAGVLFKTFQIADLTKALDPKAHGVLAGVGFLGLMLMTWFFISALLRTRLQNLIWNQTRLGSHRFDCRLRTGRVCWIQATNLLGIMLTFGLFTPFARIRMMRYRLQSISLVGDEDLDRFIAQAAPETGSVGEGVSDILDFDIAL